MSIKVLGGRVKGLTLATHKKSSVRPTSVLLRRKIFDHFQDLSQVIFVDCCAGSGAMGIEAWSRNAETVYLIESDEATYSFLLKNTGKVSSMIKDEMRTRRIMTYRSFIEKWILYFFKEFLLWPEERRDSTIFFLDPPYRKWETYKFVIDKIMGLDNFHGQLWIESNTLDGPPLEKLEFWGKKSDKIFQHSDSFVAILQF